MDVDAIKELLRQQAGVVSRRQILSCGGNDRDIARLVRRHVLHRLHPGVFIDHNGPCSWEQEIWAAVLKHWPAAVTGHWALVAHGLTVPRWLRRAGGRTDTDVGPESFRSGPRRQVHAPLTRTVDVVVAAHRHPQPNPTVQVRRVADFDEIALLHLNPPRVRVEHAVLEVASAAPDEASAIGVLADAVQSRHTTAQRLLEAVGQRPRLARRKFLSSLLADVAAGAFSALEHRYLHRVERRHGLPTAHRQRRERREHGVVFRDADYTDFGVIVELDGRLGHEWAEEAWDDLDRDIDALVDQRVTLRVRWRQVLDPCRLAASVARLLWVRGWTGRPRACGPTCAVAALLRTRRSTLDDGDPHADSA